MNQDEPLLPMLLGGVCVFCMPVALALLAMMWR